MRMVIKTGCLIDVSEMAIPFSFSGEDMSYPQLSISGSDSSGVSIGMLPGTVYSDVEKYAKVARQTYSIPVSLFTSILYRCFSLRASRTFD